MRVEVADESRVGPSRHVGQLHLGPLADPHGFHLVLEDLDVHPDGGQVRQLVEIHSRPDVHAVERRVHLLDDHPGYRGDHRERAPRRLLPLERFDLFVCDVPVAEPGACRCDQRLRPGGDVGVLRGVEPLGIAHRVEVVGLGGDQLRAVDVEENLALLDRLPEIVHRNVLDPAVDLGVHPGDLLVVVGNGADGVDGLRDVATLDGRRPDPDALYEGRVDAHRALRLALCFVRVHRDEIHAHGGFARPVRNEVRVHGGPPVEDLPFSLCGRVVRSGTFAGVLDRQEGGRPLPAAKPEHQKSGDPYPGEEAAGADCQSPIHDVLGSRRGTRVPMPLSRSASAMRKSER